MVVTVSEAEETVATVSEAEETVPTVSESFFWTCLFETLVHLLHLNSNLSVAWKYLL